MLRKIYLHGVLGSRFGKTFELDVSSLAEVGRALSALVPGFRDFAMRANFHCVAGPAPDRGFQLDNDMLDLKLGKQDVHLILAPSGSGLGGKKGAIAKIVLGVLLIGIGVFLIPAGAAVAGMSSMQMVLMGAGMLFQGISTLLALNNKDKDDSSKQFNGSIPMARHGDCVPVAYGKTLIQSPKAISGGVYSSDLAIPSTGKF